MPHKNDILISSKRCHFDVIAWKWRRFDVITTLLLRVMCLMGRTKVECSMYDSMALLWHGQISQRLFHETLNVPLTREVLKWVWRIFHSMTTEYVELHSAIYIINPSRNSCIAIRIVPLFIHQMGECSFVSSEINFYVVFCNFRSRYYE